MNVRVLVRMVCILCVACLIPWAIGSAEEISYLMAGFDGDESAHQWATNAFFSRMEARTGIHFTFDEYTDFTKWQEAKERMFSSGPLPDVFFKAELNTEELIRYTESGQIIDLKPLLETNAPHLWALLMEHPDWMEAITLPNGKIGALPTISQMPLQNALWINLSWLNELRLEMPADAQSLQEVLRAFQRQDPNRNGKQDEIPLTFLGVWDLKFLSHAFGVVVNDYNLYLDVNGDVHYWPMEDSFIELLRYLRGLYEEKLLDQNGFFAVDAMRTSTDQNAPVTYGIFWGPNPLSILNYEQSKQFVLLPPLNHGGQQIYRDLYGEIIRGAFAISSACDDPEALLRWVDFLYTEEGAIQAMAGLEGSDYVLDDEGFWMWKGGMENLSASELNDLSLYDTGNMPWLFPLEFYNRFAEEGVRSINDETLKIRPYVVKPAPNISLTLEESAQVLPLQNELGAFVDECFARFVLGQTAFTEESIAAFRQGLLDRGAEDMISFWQGVYQRAK